MDSLTKGSGIAVSALIAATASVVLLLPGHPRTGSWQSTGTSGGVMVASAAATSAPSPPQPGGRLPAASMPAPARPAASSHPACRSTGVPGGRGRPGLSGPGRRGRQPAQARPGSCRSPREHRHQEAPGRLAMYRGIRPELPR